MSHQPMATKNNLCHLVPSKMSQYLVTVFSAALNHHLSTRCHITPTPVNKIEQIFGSHDDRVKSTGRTLAPRTGAGDKREARTIPSLKIFSSWPSAFFSIVISGSMLYFLLVLQCVRPATSPRSKCHHVFRIYQDGD